MPFVKRQRGRPPAEVTAKQIELLASKGCTQQEIAVGLGVSRTTTWRRMQSAKMQIAFERGCALRGIKIREAAWKKGVDQLNPQMLIWLSKQYLGQRDKVEHTGADGGPLQVTTLNLDALSLEEALAFRAMLEKVQSTAQATEETAQDVEATTIATGRVNGRANGHG